jgi:ABC-type phosphate/phosphonate transport system substrate-binding protein
MSAPSDLFDDLRRRWAREAAERGDHAAVAVLEGDADVPADPCDAIEALHREAEDDQSIPWRRAA